MTDAPRLAAIAALLLVGAVGAAVVARRASRGEGPWPTKSVADAPDLFAGRHPITRGVERWGDRLIVRAEPVFVADVPNARLSRLTVLEDGSVLDLAMHGRTAMVIARVEGLNASLFAARAVGGGWEPRALPPDLAKEKAYAVRVAADATTLVVWGRDRLYRADGEGWIPIAEGTLLHLGDRGPEQALVVSGRLYLGYYRGEAGGGLTSFDLQSGESRLEPAPDNRGGDGAAAPVTGMTLDARGHLWAARGRTPPGGHTGTLHELDGDTWRLRARTPENADGSDAVGWNLGRALFAGLGFDPSGRLHVVTPEQGLVRLDGVAWTVVTPSWRGRARPSGVAFSGNRAVVGTWDVGVLSVDVETGAGRRFLGALPGER